jgi:aspartokinase/homoserine dehydrogenase 1
MIVRETGVTKEDMAQGKPASLEHFIEQVKTSGAKNKVFVDCSSSEIIPSCYPALLECGISVVTPNKKGLSGNLAAYTNLKKTARRSRTSFCYETTVGAALPVLSTLGDLIRTGDTIRSIEAVLSGTLSYIFNTFCANDTPFSQIVREAKEKGYTEPDPRDDLSGLDVARKILILARESGNALELSDITIEPILPKECFDASDLETFFASLKALDPVMDQKRAKAKERGNVLRFIASLHNGKASVGLGLVDETSPFATLWGSDNMIVFYTDRYSDTPLVVRGPGAGAYVTAAGVLADILKTVA